MLRTLTGCVVILVGTTTAASLIAQHTAAPPAAPDSLWSALAAGNHRFLNGKSERRDPVARRKQLTASQNPHVAVIGCADSRVPPEIVFDQGLGDLFVVRSAGESADPLSVGSLEYAVEHLGTTMIVVLGHQHCGAVQAACSGEPLGSPNLEAVVSSIKASCSKVDKSKPDLYDLAVRDHVHTVADRLVSTSEMLKHAVAQHKLTVVEAYYSLDTGEVTKLR
jgi:carbonic anhydrase